MKRVILLSLLVNWYVLPAQDDLSLAGAIRNGLENNFDIQISKRAEEITIRNNSWGQAGVFPTIDLNLTGGTIIALLRTRKRILRSRYLGDSSPSKRPVGSQSLQRTPAMTRRAENSRSLKLDEVFAVCFTRA